MNSDAILKQTAVCERFERIAMNENCPKCGSPRWRHFDVYMCMSRPGDQSRECRIRELEAAIRDAVKSLACRCDPAYTDRGRHEPNAPCYEVAALAKVLKGNR